uniref:Uncharacterized protein n=1 Tax=uncultured Desulfobacterium sp. TaxID=201089 RepID=E1YDQ8_9BACT|nr:hypothetical protein N47_G40260 [uncultured Desulfobacterium sp.]
MPGLKVYSSNKLEILSQKLSEIVRVPLSGFLEFPLSPEVIIVQSKSMEHWISLQLAKQNGICANCRFPFPNAFVDDIIKLFFRIFPRQIFLHLL